MSFIGIICENKNVSYIKQTLKRKLKDENIVIFNKDNIENLKNIKFNIIAIFNNNNIIISKEEVIKNIIQKANYLVINADKEINLNLLQDLKVNAITYGFNSKSTVTASSVSEEEVLLCIQRNIQDLNKKEIELQEISIQKVTPKLDTDIIMGLATILILEGKNEIKL